MNKAHESPSIPISETPYMLADGVPVMNPDMTVPEAAKRLNANRVGMAVVVDDNGKVLGVLSKTDIVRVTAEWPSCVGDLKITHLFTREAVTCSETDDAAALLEMMIERDIHHVPIVSSQRLVGLISQVNLRTFLTTGGQSVETADPELADNPFDKINLPEPPVIEDIFDDEGVDEYLTTGLGPPYSDKIEQVYNDDDFNEDGNDGDSGFGLVDYVPDSSHPKGKRPIPSIIFVILIFAGVFGYVAFKLSN